MSTESGVLRQSHRVALRVWFVAAVMLVVVVGTVLAIELSSRIDTAGPAANQGVRGVPAPNKTFPVPDYGIRQHAPNQIPKQLPVPSYDIRPHGPHQMPKREPIRPAPPQSSSRAEGTQRHPVALDGTEVSGPKR